MGEGWRDEEVASQKNWIEDECKNQYPIFDQNSWKTIPFGAAYTYIVHIREYPPPPGCFAQYVLFLYTPLYTLG